MDEGYRKAVDREQSLPRHTSSGKGDRPRKVNRKRYREAWDRIFGKKKADK